MLKRVLAAFLAITPFQIQAEVEEDLTLGIETVSGLRSSYLYRGFKLSETTLEFQVETAVSLRNDSALTFAAWQMAETGGDFGESAVSLGLEKSWDSFRLSTSVDYHAFSNSLFDDGLDVGLQAQWFLSENWDLSFEGRYDFGASGSYFSLEGAWSRPLNKDFFISAISGISAVGNYYEREGFNDFHGRVSLTYNVNSFLALTTFAGASFALSDEADHEAYAGLWLAVSF